MLACWLGGGSVNRFERYLVMAICLLCFPWLSGILGAAQLPRLGEESYQELDEILVNGVKEVTDPWAYIEWLKRLVGTYSYEGNVEVAGSGVSAEHRPVVGTSLCVAFGLGVKDGVVSRNAVQCELQVHWQNVTAADGRDLPDGLAILAPAMVIYGIDWLERGIRYLQVDSRGVAEGGLGSLMGNTLVTTSTCADRPGECKRTSYITARPDGGLITMRIDIERDAVLLARQTFVLRRVGQIPPLIELPSRTGRERKR